MQQPFNGPADLKRMIDLVLAYPDHNLHVVDLAYRLCSWAVQTADNCALWEDEQGQLVGWAVAQRPFAALDYAFRPDQPELERSILSWGIQRWKHIARETNKTTYFYVGVRDSQSDRSAFFSEYGLKLDKWALSHMRRLFDAPILQATVPDGFTIRPLLEEAEALTCAGIQRAAFQSENMTEDWRRRIRQAPQYVPALDLVVVAPDQRLAAFCLGWLQEVQGKRVGQVEPIAVHPDYQDRGLGRALLAEALTRMQAAGADHALIEADTTDLVTQHLYQAMGFQTICQTQPFYAVFEVANRAE